MITVSAPGKIHLMGEHAVVYGKPAFLSAINLRLQVSVEPFSSGVVIDHSDPLVIDFISYALEIIKKEYDLSVLPGMRITLQSDIPFGYHLGSSASLAVATVGAVVYFLKKLWNPNEINRLAYEVEKKQHGSPSGGDNTTVTFGGFLWFRKELEFLKSVWQLPITLPSSLSHFFLINTGRPVETTGEMVALVASQVNKQPEKMEHLFAENERQTKRVATAIKEGNEINLLDALKKGERTLEEFGVVSDLVIPCIRAIESAGGAAKILGGGGKKAGVGFLLCYHPDFVATEKLCAPYGFTPVPIEMGGDGIRLERKN